MSCYTKKYFVMSWPTFFGEKILCLLSIFIYLMRKICHFDFPKILGTLENSNFCMFLMVCNLSFNIGLEVDAI